MSGARSGAPPTRRGVRDEIKVGWATGIGVTLAVVGLVDGLAMALKRRVATCPDGKIFPEGTTDYTCYVHPQGGIGVAVAVFSVLLGILVVFGSILVRAALREGAAEPGDAAAPQSSGTNR